MINKTLELKNYDNRDSDSHNDYNYAQMRM